MTYFQHSVPLEAGKTIKAAPINTLFQGVQASFDLLPEATDGGFNSTLKILDATSGYHAITLAQLWNVPNNSPTNLIDVGANRLSNAIDPVNDQDLVTKAWSVANHGNSLADSQAAALSAVQAAASAAETPPLYEILYYATM